MAPLSCWASDTVFGLVGSWAPVDGTKGELVLDYDVQDRQPGRRRATRRSGASASVSAGSRSRPPPTVATARPPSTRTRGPRSRNRRHSPQGQGRQGPPSHPNSASWSSGAQAHQPHLKRRYGRDRSPRRGTNPHRHLVRILNHGQNRAKIAHPVNPMRHPLPFQPRSPSPVGRGHPLLQGRSR